MRRKDKAACACIAAFALAAALGLAGCGSADSEQAPEGADSAVEVAADASGAEPAADADELAAADAAVPVGEAVELADGLYEANFNTDSSMFHVNEAKDGKGELTVENGRMTIHVPLVSKRIVNLYLGTAEEAKADEANWIQPIEEEVTYSDGYTKTVYAFDIPVSTIGEPFAVALIGKKGTWYNHTVSVTDPQPLGQ